MSELRRAARGFRNTLEWTEVALKQPGVLLGRAGDLEHAPAELVCALAGLALHARMGRLRSYGMREAAHELLRLLPLPEEKPTAAQMSDPPLSIPPSEVVRMHASPMMSDMVMLCSIEVNEARDAVLEDAGDESAWRHLLSMERAVLCALPRWVPHTRGADCLGELLAAVFGDVNLWTMCPVPARAPCEGGGTRTVLRMPVDEGEARRAAAREPGDHTLPWLCVKSTLVISLAAALQSNRSVAAVAGSSMCAPMRRFVAMMAEGARLRPPEGGPRGAANEDTALRIFTAHGCSLLRAAAAAAPKSPRAAAASVERLYAALSADEELASMQVFPFLTQREFPAAPAGATPSEMAARMHKAAALSQRHLLTAADSMRSCPEETSYLPAGGFKCLLVTIFMHMAYPELSRLPCADRVPVVDHAVFYAPTLLSVACGATCAACGAIAAPFKCAACRSADYCGQGCQNEHWRAHKAACRAARAHGRA